MITFDIEGIETAKILLKDCPSKISVAAANAVNHTARKLRTTISKTIRKEYIVPAAEIKKSLNVQRASRVRLTGLIKSTGRPVPLDVFKVNTPKKGGALKAKVLKRKSPIAVPGMFYGTSLKGYTGLMMREHRKQSYPLKIPHGPSVPQMLGSEVVVDSIAEEAGKHLNERFLHEVNFQLQKYKGGQL